MASEVETQKATKITTSKDVDGKVNLLSKVTVYGTGKGPMEEGKAYEVHPIHAETIIKKGFATKNKPKKEDVK